MTLISGRIATRLEYRCLTDLRFCCARKMSPVSQVREPDGYRPNSDRLLGTLPARSLDGSQPKPIRRQGMAAKRCVFRVVAA